MIEKIANQIESFNSRVTLVSAGPSKRIEALRRLKTGLLISVNNAIDAPYQFLIDAIGPESGTGIYPNEIKDQVDGLYFKSQKMGYYHPVIHGKRINRDWPTDSKALAFAVKNGAQHIRMIGFDFFNPWNRTRNYIGATKEMVEENDRFNTVPMKMLDSQPRTKEWDRYEKNKKFVELSISYLKTEYDVKFYNLSPVTDIDGAKRLHSEA